ncbi:glycoside hydrolase family 72 protein [Lactifluus subvellereus]|nr:glycoside hydrolase family 72 protein [Lactifluus subvellereus]
MVSFPPIAAALAVALSLASIGSAAINPITRSGRYLYFADGTRFFIKGIAYQPQGAVVADPNAPFSEPTTFVDPLADGAACQRDAPIIQAAGVNTIRVYNVDASKNHDTCMQTFSAAGIYTVLDLGLPVNGSINRAAPAWTTNLLNSYIRTIDAFSKYDNVLVYNIGNEVVINPQTTSTLAFVKAAARDTKAYLASKKSTALVGYAAIDGDDTWVVPLASTNSASTAIDIFGLNNYEWCGQSTFQASYAAKTTDFANYNVVAYFSEYGCNNPEPRQWSEVAGLFGAQAAPVWSGGVAFSYFPATSDAGQFGMVTVSADGTTVTPNADFTNLKAAYTQVAFVNNPAQANAPAAAYPACPQPNANFLASATLPPTPGDVACQCLENNLSCQFNPQVANPTVIIGTLLDGACALLTGQGGNCNPIAGNGQTGTYGVVAQCSPSTKLSFAMSEWYEANKRNPQACSFAGNGTVNSRASTASSAAQVVNSCLAAATSTFVPTEPTVIPLPSGSPNKPGSPSSSGSGSQSSSTRGAASTVLVSDARTLLGVFLMLAISAAGGLLSMV